MRPALPLLAMNKVRALSAINSCYASRPASFALSERSAQSIPATLLAPRPSRSESAQRNQFLLRSSPRVLRAQRALSAIPTTLLASRPSRSESAQRDSYYAPRLASFVLREREAQSIPATLLASRPSRSGSAKRNQFLLRFSPRVLRAL